MSNRGRRAQRSDAKANRERILETAERLFDEGGIDTPISAIIKELGIGPGTFYRHFPTAEDLLVGVYDRLTAALIDLSERCWRIPDSWDRICGFIDGSSELLIEHPAFAALMLRVGATRPDHDPAFVMRDALKNTVQQAIDDGYVRSDLTGADIAMVPFLLAAWSRSFPMPMQRRSFERAKALMMDGITRRDGTALPGPPISADEFRSAAHGLPE